jgi:hypothetical protein
MGRPTRPVVAATIVVAATGPAAAWATAPLLWQVLQTPGPAAVLGCSIGVGALVAIHGHRQWLVDSEREIEAAARRGFALAPGPESNRGPEVTGPGFPMPPRPVIGSGPACHGQLVNHTDGHMTCHGGRNTCVPETGVRKFGHRNSISCADLSHGCGECLPAGSPL